MGGDEYVLEIAGRQYGAIHRRQLSEAGLTRAMIDQRRRRGWLIQVAPKVDVVRGWPAGFDQRLMAATLQSGGVASHRAAAELHRIPHVERGVIEVTKPNRSHHPVDGVVVHLAGRLCQPDVTTVRGIPSTSLIRSVFDLGLLVRPARMRRIIESMVIARRVELPQLRCEFEAQARSGRNGTVMIREVLDELDPDLGRVGSELEARFLRFLEDHGLPRPTQQFPLPWRTPRPGFSDHAFVQQRLLVELDGRIWHSDSASFESDHDRDLQATLHGWSVMRITARQLDGTPQLVAHALRRVLDDPAA